jgi:uncharacterized surface protein with fasciclin (FAS1) repeats
VRPRASALGTPGSIRAGLHRGCERFAADVVESDRIRTLDRSFADISVTMDGVFIDQAEIVAPDAADVDNGVIHIIDAVILPF